MVSAAEQHDNHSDAPPAGFGPYHDHSATLIVPALYSSSFRSAGKSSRFNPEFSPEEDIDSQDHSGEKLRHYILHYILQVSLISGASSFPSAGSVHHMPVNSDSRKSEADHERPFDANHRRGPDHTQTPNQPAPVDGSDLVK